MDLQQREEGRLSQRGERSVELGGALKGFRDILDNLCHPELNPDGYVSLGIAENLLMHDEMTEFANSRANGSAGSKRLRAAVARFLNRNFHPHLSVETSHVSVLSGITKANEMLAWLIADPGDAFLLGRPYYGTFPMDYMARASVKTVGVDFGHTDPSSVDALAHYEDALLQAKIDGVVVKALMLCSPHNPLGRCFAPEVLKAFLAFCQKHQIHIISDEVYALSVWHNRTAPDAPTFTSLLSIDLTGIIDPGLVHVLWGMSKDFGANGLRLGFLVDQGNNLLETSFSSLSLFSCPSSASDHIATIVLEDDQFTESFIRTNKQRLSRNYEFVTEGQSGIFILWADLRKASGVRGPRHVNNESSLSTRLLSKKVYLAEGELFGGEPGWFRIVFSQPKAY
ncbi:PLP-dependent transferase [Aspergillus eucalypticola CBS 122712]|uniref:PLP-dependent transferase n=1 Tax=Aspergillus eucalypticola (strain CBS 122712 / IBT 29274) TaxID=1448314 RepID=A0A317UVJ4_ASPEC|nr:PLP-dependent transferase [Aspergillus eucalypticola CBS 122712]PWY65058.1 PLP-dependent transferase [Aspergillus eucalypticola CBS 122712]